MIKFKLKQSESILLTSQSGLVFIGAALEHFVDIDRIDEKFASAGIATSDIIRSYVGLLAAGKSDFEAIENVREDEFFKRALGVKQVASSATLRQRLDEMGESARLVVDEWSVALLKAGEAPVSALGSGHVAVDIDVFPMDNRDTRKQGVGRTYAGYDGYAPIAAYLGEEGWCLGLELRPGTQHSAKDTPGFVTRCLKRARGLSALPLLLRMDSGFDGAEILLAAAQEAIDGLQAGGAPIDVLIKANPRKFGVQGAHQGRCEDPNTVWRSPREGKRVTLWEDTAVRRFGKDDTSLRRIYRLAERSIVKGQPVLLAGVRIDVWETSLALPVEQVIELYCQHATHEQFHSEIKTDLDLERLPSGKFATNGLVLSLGALTYNILRLMGQQALLGPDAPVRHRAKRRRLKTVMQELIYRAAKCTRQAGRWVLDFGRAYTAFVVFERMYRVWSSG